jgi:hypothetical protein
MVTVFSLISFFNDRSIPLLKDLVMLFTDNPKILDYLDPKTRWGFLFFWTIPIIFTLVSLYLLNFSKIDKKQNFISPLNFLYFNLLSLFHLPFYMYTSNFTRLSRNYYLLQYGFLSKFKTNNFFDLLIKSSLILFIFIQGYIILFGMGGYYQTIILEILSNNIIQSFLN